MIVIRETEKLLKDTYLQTIREGISKGERVNTLSVAEILGSRAVVGGIEYELQNWFGTITITDKAFHAAEDNPTAFVNLLSGEIESMVERLAAQMDAMAICIDIPKMRLYQLCDWTWLTDENGSILKQDISNPWYTATLVKYAVIAPKGNGGAK
jgi:hypothetical protein